jgi:hypothetical protein
MDLTTHQHRIRITGSCRERERREVGASDLVVPCCAITRAQPFFRVGAWGVGSEGTGACVRGRFSGLYGSIIGVVGLFR